MGKIQQPGTTRNNHEQPKWWADSQSNIWPKVSSITEDTRILVDFLSGSKTVIDKVYEADDSMLQVFDIQGMWGGDRESKNWLKYFISGKEFPWNDEAVHNIEILDHLRITGLANSLIVKYKIRWDSTIKYCRIGGKNVEIESTEDEIDKKEGGWEESLWKELVNWSWDDYVNLISNRLNTKDIIKQRKFFMEFVEFISIQDDDYFKFNASNYDKLIKIITIFNTNGTFNNHSDLVRSGEVEENMTKKIMKSTWLDEKLYASSWFWVDNFRNPTNFAININLRVDWDISYVDRYIFTRDWKVTKDEINWNHSSKKKKYMDLKKE